MKRKLCIAATVLFLVFALGVLFLLQPFIVAQKLSRRYSLAERGMTSHQIEALMGRSGQWLPAPPQYAAWDDVALPPTETESIASVLRHTVRTFPFPVSFKFAFDSQGLLIGRHVYD